MIRTNLVPDFQQLFCICRCHPSLISNRVLIVDNVEIVPSSQVHRLTVSKRARAHLRPVDIDPNRDLRRRVGRRNVVSQIFDDLSRKLKVVRVLCSVPGSNDRDARLPTNLLAAVAQIQAENIDSVLHKSRNCFHRSRCRADGRDNLGFRYVRTLCARPVRKSCQFQSREPTSLQVGRISFIRSAI